MRKVESASGRTHLIPDDAVIDKYGAVTLCGQHIDVMAVDDSDTPCTCRHCARIEQKAAMERGEGGAE